MGGDIENYASVLLPELTRRGLVDLSDENNMHQSGWRFSGSIVPGEGMFSCCTLFPHAGYQCILTHYMTFPPRYSLMRTDEL